MDRIIKWNKHYQTIDSASIPLPCQVLKHYSHLLPTAGTALDFACGLGANALFLAQHGLNTYAWDYAATAIKHLQIQAKKQQLKLNTEIRDIIAYPPAANSFDVIVVCHFLDRNTIAKLIQALKLNGLIFYQTFTQISINSSHPKNPDFLLKNNELLRLFSDLQLVIYQEEANIGDITQGFRNEALLIAKKV
ncbi:MAG: methyltransferase domain-containing protein [Thiomargarita sp.]|nr:methyltransferase domain-containing protein [Thiomargarita sp.]